jgi:hypothetical protein
MRVNSMFRASEKILTKRWIPIVSLSVVTSHTHIFAYLSGNLK